MNVWSRTFLDLYRLGIILIICRTKGSPRPNFRFNRDFCCGECGDLGS